jgi:hypothetical protein
MKPQFFMAVTFIMALGACAGDVKTSATGPGAAYCDEVCACESCSSAEVGSCSDEIKSLSDQADSSGCGAPFSGYLGCLEGLSCEGGLVDDSECNAQYASLSQCLNPAPMCSTAGDGVCDEPEGTNTCAEGADPGDCGGPPPCLTINDDVCDEPEGTGTCAEGTDTADCGGPPPPCSTINNGLCDEPEGSNTCPEGTDVNDCNTPSGGCNTYCSTIQSNCTGSNAQFASMDTCLATCATLPLGMDADMVGNSVGCRTYHGTAAKFDPDTHCIHAGPSGGGVCGDYCESFCAIVPKVCLGLYPTSKECMFECSQFPNAEPYDASDTSGDSFACRLYHATIASVDPATHCSHVNEASPVCK